MTRKRIVVEAAAANLIEDTVGLLFEDRSGEEIEVFIRQDYFRLVLQMLEEKGFEASQGVAIPQRPAIGETFELAGYQVSPSPEGGVRLTFHIGLEAGGRSLPVNLSAKQARDLAETLKHVVARS